MEALGRQDSNNLNRVADGVEAMAKAEGDSLNRRGRT
jgi:hypothetical protein